MRTFDEQKSKKKNPNHQSATPQPKLDIGQPGDKYEKEADAIADRVSNEGVGNFESSVNLKDSRSPGLQLKSNPNFNQAKSPAQSGPQQSENHKQSGKPLVGKVKAKMENSLGADLSNVRLHTGPEAEKMNNHLGSQAFTHGNDIYFNKGKYKPGSKQGQHLLAHELTHTQQQAAHQRLSMFNGGDPKGKVKDFFMRIFYPWKFPVGQNILMLSYKNPALENLGGEFNPGDNAMYLNNMRMDYGPDWEMGPVISDRANLHNSDTAVILDDGFSVPKKQAGKISANVSFSKLSNMVSVTAVGATEAAIGSKALSEQAIQFIKTYPGRIPSDPAQVKIEIQNYLLGKNQGKLNPAEVAVSVQQSPTSQVVRVDQTDIPAVKKPSTFHARITAVESELREIKTVTDSKGVGSTAEFELNNNLSETESNTVGTETGNSNTNTNTTNNTVGGKSGISHGESNSNTTSGEASIDTKNSTTTGVDHTVSSSQSATTQHETSEKDISGKNDITENRNSEAKESEETSTWGSIVNFAEGIGGKKVKIVTGILKMLGLGGSDYTLTEVDETTTRLEIHTSKEKAERFMQEYQKQTGESLTVSRSFTNEVNLGSKVGTSNTAGTNTEVSGELFGQREWGNSNSTTFDKKKSNSATNEQITSSGSRNTTGFSQTQSIGTTRKVFDFLVKGAKMDLTVEKRKSYKVRQERKESED